MASVLQQLAGLLRDPAPEFAFEISERGIAWARDGGSPQFQPLEPGVLTVSPLADNVLKYDALADAIRRITGGPSVARKRRRAVLILPDHSARLSVMRFEQFPTDPKEQASLVRFRMRKSVPFDIDAAALSFEATSAKPPLDVIVAVCALDIVARYEAAFRSAGVYPGHVTTSSLSAAELVRSAGVSVLARRAGRLMSVSVIQAQMPKLVRTVELAHEDDPEEVLSVLFPTLAYIEDELGTQAGRVVHCGFEEGGRTPEWFTELQIPAERLQSRFGAPDGSNAGLLGYIESVSGGVKAA
ncbi:MAG TPA: hypothetical protein VES20_20050 [Bryobacteraceae bacterium]|nr:hypothetical protein [Bryobacteraceae bacterium]